jgi:hypothetical protein
VKSACLVRRLHRREPRRCRISPSW